MIYQYAKKDKNKTNYLKSIERDKIRQVSKESGQTAISTCSFVIQSWIWFNVFRLIVASVGFNDLMRLILTIILLVYGRQAYIFFYQSLLLENVYSIISFLCVPQSEPRILLHAGTKFYFLICDLVYSEHIPNVITRIRGSRSRSFLHGGWTTKWKASSNANQSWWTYFDKTQVIVGTKIGLFL